MNECCVNQTSDHNPPKQARCPVNGKSYKSVGHKTILHHLAQPWDKHLSGQSYYFCTDADCEVVYFAEDNSVITRPQLRTKVGIKETSPERTLCYCFGVTYATAEQHAEIEDFVKTMTQQHNCACQTSNPSGRCCLKDFPQQ